MKIIFCTRNSCNNNLLNTRCLCAYVITSLGLYAYWVGYFLYIFLFGFINGSHDKTNGKLLFISCGHPFSAYAPIWVGGCNRCVCSMKRCFSYTTCAQGVGWVGGGSYEKCNLGVKVKDNLVYLYTRYIGQLFCLNRRKMRTSHFLGNNSRK